MNLSNLKPPPGQKHKKRRLGQGMGTGRGKYSGRGAKGAKSISGYSQMRGFEGGQMPLHRRLPKRGFTNIFRREYAIINLGRLAELEGDSFTPESLLKLGAIRKPHAGLKVLGEGELTRGITVRAHFFSKSALEKIEKAGGKAEVIELPKKAGEAEASSETAKPAAAPKPKKAAAPKPPAEAKPAAESEAPAAEKKPKKAAAEGKKAAAETKKPAAESKKAEPKKPSGKK